MRFIGNKEKLLNIIYSELSSRNIKGCSFFDFFSGTSTVGKFFKKKGYQVFSSDILYFSYVLQKAYIENNISMSFKKLLGVLGNHNSSTPAIPPLDLVVEHLNLIKPKKGFIYNNYAPSGTSTLNIPRMYFSDQNAKKIDAIREQIELWKNALIINENEYYILIACLIETVPFYANISGVYAAFHKKWDPRAKKKLILRTIELIPSKKNNKSFHCNSINLIEKIDTDILYLDPPYNQRQYAPNYHLLETIAKYDSPNIKGVAGLRPYDKQKSNFCNSKKGLQELGKIAKKAKYKYLVLSYNNEGIMPPDQIINTLEKYGQVDLAEFDYRRYKSNNKKSNITKKLIQEQLYILKKHHA